MDPTEEMEQLISDADFTVRRWDFLSLPLTALYFDKTILLSEKIRNSRETRCLLAEELCHGLYSSGNCLSDPKREAYARGKAYELLLPLEELQAALKAKKRPFEIAEEFSVTEEVLAAAIAHYQSKGKLPPAKEPE